MIQKVIHYCWFGGNPLPKFAKKCIASWRKHCPDYKIVEWNEKNYDVTKNKYMYDAFLAKKWAFVSDYARIDIIYNFGGIYLDTDVELIKPLDKFLNMSMFCGWEERDAILDHNNISYENSINFGLGFGAVKGHPILKEILELYDKINFYDENGKMNLMACPHYQTMILKKYGLDDTKRSFQILEKDTYVFPEDYFSPKSQTTGVIKITNNTISIHHFSETWISPGQRIICKVEKNLRLIFPYKAASFFTKIILLPIFIFIKIKKN